MKGRRIDDEMLLKAYSGFNEALRRYRVDYQKELADILFSLIVMRTLSFEAAVALSGLTESSLREELLRLTEVSDGQLLTEIDAKMAESMGLDHGDILARTETFLSGGDQDARI